MIVDSTRCVAGVTEDIADRVAGGVAVRVTEYV